MSAREFDSGWCLVECDGQFLSETRELCLCAEAVAAPSLITATASATRAGWVTRPVTVDIDGVPRQRVEHYCPTHKAVAG